MTAIHQLGKDYRVKISDGAGTPAFLTIAGEQKVSRKSSSDAIDTSSKDDGAYKTGTYGQKTISLSVNGITKIPDPGYTRLYAVQKLALPEVEVQLVNTITDEVVFQAVMGVGNFADDYDQKTGATWSPDLTLAAAPTIDIVPTGSD
ncbi:putative secreted protein [Novosphingobium sp. SG751A]|uniref:phage tail tube protein n=1 Tax=Novosphingobium sp. SG751A TaxID=2587000 RepID=UPI0015522302|nr:phage tail tube protein [Novosphingobium sp. SG751A]NOW44103.1 putative secreted protein [Novosphingobium sp. SG751A]